MRKILGAIFALFAFAYQAHAQTLPAGYLGTVTGNTPNTWQTFSYTFTPSTTGANFIGFAFRQDPAFWTFDNVRLTAAGSTTNLLTNGGFNTGGAFNVTTTNGPSSIQAPTNWGVWYQNGTYPAAAGTWQDIGGTNGGVWYDGAVGTFDGIYQGVILQAGTTYTITFDVSGNNTADTGPVQLGVYGGACASVSIAASQCTIPSSVGFTTLATPAEGASAGTPTPTLVSSVPTTPTTTSSTTYGTPTVTTQVVDTSANNRVRFTVTRTTTPITSTPFTTTTTTTLQTLETYSDGSTVTVAGTSTTSTTNGVTITTGAASSQTQQASSVTLKDMIAYRNFNPFIIDALSVKDGTWATPYLGYAKVGGSLRSTGASMGYNKTIENNSFGFGFRYEETNAHDYLNAKGDQTAYSGTAYILTKQEHIWIKASIGMSSAQYNSMVSLPSFGLHNNNNIKQNNVYSDVTIYSAKSYKGFRPLFGATVQNSNISSVRENGSPLLSTAPVKGSTNEVRPYAGVRYEFNDWLNAETRVTHSQDFKTVSQNRVNVKKSITNNTYIELGAGFDRGSNYTAGVVSAGLKITF